MSDKSISVETLDSGSPERVAFDLMEKIRFQEGKPQDPREYYLQLYLECRNVVVNGFRLGD